MILQAGLKLNIKKNKKQKTTKIMESGTITSWQIEGEKVEAVADFLGVQKSLQTVTAAMKLKDTCSLEEKL